MSKLRPDGRTQIGWSLVILLALLTALDAMSIDMYLPAFPAMADAFNVSPGRIQQTLSIFLVGLALGQGLYGPLLDRYGRRVPLLLGIGVFIVGSVLAAVAPTMESLLFARFLQALGASAGLVAPRAIVADVCSVKESARVFSILMQVMMVAPITAPIVGGFLVLHAGWRSIFWLLAAVAVAGGLWAVRSLPETLPRERRIPLRARTIIQTYYGLCRHRAFFLYALAGGFILGSLFAYISASPFVFIEHFGLTPAGFSGIFAINAVATVIGAQLGIWLLARTSPQRILTGGLLAHIFSGFALFLIVWTDSATLWLYFSLLALAISALGMTFGTHAALTMEQAGRQTGAGSALMGLFQYVLAAGVGFLLSLASPGLASLPLTLTFCGVCAWTLCYVARRPSALLPAADT